jgi:microcystin degradation protein MlrC
MRVAIGQIWQEQNSFSPVLTELSDFEQNGLYFGDSILKKFARTNELGGFIRAAEEDGDVELLPTVRAFAWPKGNVKKHVYKKIKQEFKNRIIKSLPLDGILLSLHGSMVAEELHDVEGDLLKTITHDLSIDVPVAISLDLHANITQDIAENAVYIEAYHTCPHVDLFRTGYKTAQVLFSILKKEIEPAPACMKMPMITPARLHDSRRGPLKKIFTLIEKIEKEPDVIGASFFPVQPWLDVPELGWSVAVYSRVDRSRAKHYAEEIACFAWKNKDSFFIEETPLVIALEEANEMEEGMMVISDSDSTTSGAPGDNTCVLQELLKRDVRYQALLSLVDPEVVKKALRAGVEGEITCEIGGKLDSTYCSPVKVTAMVKRITDGRFTINGGHIGKQLINMGKTVVLKTGNISILVSEKPGPVYEQTVFTHAGLDPKNFRVVVVKSPVGFRDAYESIAKKIVLADCPGFSSSNLHTFEYKNIPHPLYPFDEVGSRCAFSSIL